MVQSAGLQARDGAKHVLTRWATQFPGVPLIWAEGSDAGQWVEGVAATRQRTLALVKRPRHTPGFRGLQWRWIGERPFGWLNRSRRLSKDCEARPETTETWIRMAMIHLMVRRLAGTASPFQTGSEQTFVLSGGCLSG
jgi:putative transposase